MDHAHHWQIDGHGLGVCAFLGCRETRQFDNSWEANYQRKSSRPIEQVGKEMAALRAMYHSPRVLPLHADQKLDTQW